MDKELLTLVHKQINEELFSAYAYLAISARAEILKLPGFASWFRVQAQEEIGHAMGFFNHLAKRGENIELDVLAKPELKLPDCESLVNAGLEHEKHITATIHNLKTQAQAHNDPMLDQLLNWYVHEQQEEEESLGQLLEKVRNAESLASLDQELGQRVFTPELIE